MLYEVKNGTISLGGNVILSHFFFRMVDGEKIGIVGRNGAGKSTLLRLIHGDIGLDYNDDNTVGEIVKSKDFNCGYLKQELAGSIETTQVLVDGKENSTMPISNTAYAYLIEAYDNLIEIEEKISKLTLELEKNYDESVALELNSLIDKYNYDGGETYLKELKTGFKKFGFSDKDFNKKLSEFSGGQLTKISLLKMLLTKPNILLLDEPTNHLDIEAVEWMEGYLKNYKNNILIVSHDRMFLDNVCNVIYDTENKTLTRYEGNYSSFIKQKEINYELAIAKYNKNLKEIDRLTQLTERFRYKATKSKMVQSKDKIIAKLEEKTFMPQSFDTKTFHAEIIPKSIGGKEVLRCTNLSVGYDRPIATIDLVVDRGDRVAVVGANGTGKTTFIKTIVGLLPQLSGEFSYGHEIMYEYFDQRIAENNSNMTLIDDFSSEFPTYTSGEVRNKLGRFLFEGDDVFKRICDLSGGEKVRLALAKIFERKPNLLVLDEPTNHLDILGKESLESILQDYLGTVIFVSHDRYFVKKISNKVLYFENKVGSEENLSVTKFFQYGYLDYENYIREKDISESVIEKGEGKERAHGMVQASINLSQKKHDNPGINLSKEKKKADRKMARIEEEISKIEKSISDIEKEMEKEEYHSDFKKLSDLHIEMEKLKKELDQKYDEWGQGL